MVVVGGVIRKVAIEEVAKVHSIIATVNDITDTWNRTKMPLDLVVITNEEPDYILAPFDEKRALLDEHMVTLQSLAPSRYAIPFVEAINNLEEELSTISAIIDIAHMVYNKNNILTISRIPDLLQELEDVNAGLDECRKSLNNYLDYKRLSFPRFFFLSDDEMLSIYGTHEYTAIQEHMLKIRQRDISLITRKKYNTSLIIDVHSKDIIERFIKENVIEPNDFLWESQLRFYWERATNDLTILQCTGSFAYGYEYMGLNGRLVITPLTDRIYLTLTQALSMNLGAAPAGPAGTGKTETTKDLAKALGLLCIVTNCGENTDILSINKILAGLCQCGAWGCFDEFNRIDVSVLSVISTQLKIIQDAMIQRIKTFKFENMMIYLDPKVGFFVTMNPGYTGRTELPESVKSFFRPVVCIVPDLQLICEVILFSEGFSMAKILAKKITVFYNLSSQLLSQQFHYDFGLRSMKCVLMMAGDLKHDSPNLKEDMIIMRALRDMNLPKFVQQDVYLFTSLLSDLFPDTYVPRILHPELKAAINHQLKTDNLTLVNIR
ncbi:hypothetical protein LAZ67_X001178 [Cordylochernes scorpioides]|uniref:Dynein heavy chain n=1 Tax=Cordylochernes scorpioides TaxID=51811 RepID=A0ABY6LS95_9ARAC|nr:hypothetical protein LAZ67_X001178 [Cordylochernes scorpioides]